jgi:8-oxo-dGTP diphosphatase
MEKERDSFRVGVNVFCVRDGKLLLGERIGDAWPDGNGWGLPGGHLERNESMRDRARTELKEEAGLLVQELEFVGLHNNTRGNVHYIQIGFLGHDVESDPVVKELDLCRGWKWFLLNELPDHIFIGHRGLVKAFLEKRYFLDGETF